MTNPRNLLLGLLCGLIAGGFWGGVFLAPLLLHAFTPLQMTAGRYVAYGLASLLLLAPTARTVFGRMTGRDWRDLALLSLLGNLIYYVGLAVAVQNAGVAAASLIIGLLPVTVTLVGARPGEGVPIRRLAAPLALLAAGVVCINVDVFRSGEGVPVPRLIVGVLGAALALAVWTVYAVWNARRLAVTTTFNSHEWSLLTGVVTGALSLVLVIPAFFLAGGRRPCERRLGPVLGRQPGRGPGRVGDRQRPVERGQQAAAAQPVGPADRVRDPVRPAVRLPARRPLAAPAGELRDRSDAGGRAVVGVAASADSQVHPAQAPAA
jgi:drug/metabolite transporter (DMT)-like permease